MLGGTHKKIGAAAAFAILRPATIPACLGTLAAGYIGGDICDIDILLRNHPAEDEDPDRDDHYDGAWEDFASNVILFLLFILVDWYFGNGSVDWFLHNFGIRTMAAISIFALIIVCGMIAAHRSYMHSLLIGLVLSGCLYVICAPLAPAFAIGYLTHILLDLLNKTGMCLFWPLKKRFCLKLCASNKRADAMLNTAGEILSCLLVAYFLFMAVINRNQSTQILEILSSPYSEGVSNLGAWLIFINIFTFIAENTNFSLWLKGKGPYQEHDEYFDSEKDYVTQNFMQKNLYILFVLGGALGGLLSYIWIAIKHRKYIKNGALGGAIFAIGAICVVIEWACIYYAVVSPNYIYRWLENNFIGRNILYLIIYVIAVNLIAFIIYTNDDAKISRLSVKAFFELMVAFVGGAAGAFLSINLKGYVGAQKPFESTVMKMLQTHCVIIAIAIIFLKSAR